MECGRHNFLSFSANPQNIKKCKKPWRYYPLTHVYHKWRSYDVWHGRQFFVILSHFLPSDPLNNRKNENFERMKTVPEKLTFYTCVPQMIIIYKKTVWFMRYGVQQTDFLSFWTIFCPFTPLPPPLTTWKIKLLKKWKKKTTWRYHFTHAYDKWQSYDVWFLEYWVRWTEIFVILDHFLHLYPLTTLKIKILKK